ncbi:TPA: hypothetical protein DIC40_04980 [Patescibacteria group bacterium]|nr:hypothetical protein [Candidatus Gracilibacteria bacterium]
MVVPLATKELIELYISYLYPDIHIPVSSFPDHINGIVSHSSKELQLVGDKSSIFGHCLSILITTEVLIVSSVLRLSVE